MLKTIDGLPVLDFVERELKQGYQIYITHTTRLDEYYDDRGWGYDEVGVYNLTEFKGTLVKREVQIDWEIYNKLRLKFGNDIKLNTTEFDSYKLTL